MDSYQDSYFSRQCIARVRVEELFLYTLSRSSSDDVVMTEVVELRGQRLAVVVDLRAY